MLHNDHKRLPETTHVVLDHTTHTLIGPTEARLEKEGGLDGARGAPGKALIDEEASRGSGRIGSKSFGLTPPIGIVIVILMRQDARVWVDMKTTNTAKRLQSAAGAGVSRPDPMPVPDMITAKTLPIVVYRIHRRVPFRERCHKAQKTLTAENYTLPGIEVHDLIAGAKLAPFPTAATQGNIQRSIYHTL
jgi:hypothetical protein